jgi:hypothetical protein
MESSKFELNKAKLKKVLFHVLIEWTAYSLEKKPFDKNIDEDKIDAIYKDWIDEFVEKHT